MGLQEQQGHSGSNAAQAGAAITGNAYTGSKIALCPRRKRENLLFGKSQVNMGIN